MFHFLQFNKIMVTGQIMSVHNQFSNLFLQDVWIGRAEQQTRDILKCMGCGASFRSLDLLTKHMQETQHYKKVISHDQISSWKYPEAAASPKNHVNSVLTCKVCDKGFSSLKDLSDHMVII